MPLLAGKRNIGHNVTVEEEHGKPKKQAVAIALNKAGVSKGKDGDMEYTLEMADGSTKKLPRAVFQAWLKKTGETASPNFSKRRDQLQACVGGPRIKDWTMDDVSSAKDAVTPIDMGDKVALAKHAAGITRSQDKGARDYKVAPQEAKAYEWALKFTDSSDEGAYIFGGFYTNYRRKYPQATMSQAYKAMQAMMHGAQTAPPPDQAKDARQIGLPKGGGSYIGNQIKRWQEEVLPTASEADLKAVIANDPSGSRAGMAKKELERRASAKDSLSPIPVRNRANDAGVNPADVSRVYSGKPGCMCGCRGTYSTNPATIKLICGKLNNLNAKVTADWASADTPTRSYTAYFKKGAYAQDSRPAHMADAVSPIPVRSLPAEPVDMPSGERNQPELAPVPVRDTLPAGSQVAQAERSLADAEKDLAAAIKRREPSAVIDDLKEDVSFARAALARRRRLHAKSISKDANALQSKGEQFTPGAKVHNSRGSAGSVVRVDGDEVIVDLGHGGTVRWPLGKTFRAADAKAKDFVNGQNVKPSQLKPGMKIVAPNGSVQTVKYVKLGANGSYAVSTSRGVFDVRQDTLVELYVPEPQANDELTPVEVADTTYAEPPKKPAPYVPFHMSPKDIEAAYAPKDPEGFKKQFGKDASHTRTELEEYIRRGEERLKTTASPWMKAEIRKSNEHARTALAKLGAKDALGGEGASDYATAQKILGLAKTTQSVKAIARKLGGDEHDERFVRNVLAGKYGKGAEQLKEQSEDADQEPIMCEKCGKKEADGQTSDGDFLCAGCARAQKMKIKDASPEDALRAAQEAEVAGDRRAALDGYAAAAAGFRASGGRTGLGEALDGAAECRRRLVGESDGMYGHPQRGRARDCGSAETALRVALERTRAGEDVLLVGTRVMPRRGRAADADEVQCAACGRRVPVVNEKVGAHTSGSSRCGGSGGAVTRFENKARDEHEGFAKLKGELSHEKGISDPAALAASIGRKKYGAAGMAKKAAAGRAKDEVTYSVVLHGGSIGSKGPSVMGRGLLKEEAMAKAKRMTSQLSKGERGYYGMRYKVVPDTNIKDYALTPIPVGA